MQEATATSDTPTQPVPTAADIEAAFRRMHSASREALLATSWGHTTRRGGPKQEKTEKTRERSPRSIRRELGSSSEGEGGEDSVVFS